MVSVNVIILCGGKGSRVKSILGEMPKVLTPRDGEPHLKHLLSQVNGHYNDAKVFLATGIGGQFVEAFVSNEKVDVTISHETKPLGTGGAILKCMDDNHLENALVINGDTIYSCLPSINALAKLQKNTVFLCHKEDRDRFGAVEIDNEGQIQLLSKGIKTPGLVNSGIYYVTNELLNRYELDLFLSFEDQIIGSEEFSFSVMHADFKDFGVPEDLIRFTDINDD